MRIGIDLGGTKIEGIAIANDGSVEMRTRIPAPRDDYQATLAAVAGLVDEIERAIGIRGTVGVGMPGTISPATGLVKNANSTWLNGRPLADDLPRRLGRPVRFANDANCFALSEAVDGAAAGASPVFGVIIGTGTGGGVVIDGRVVTGANAIAGEWGHNPLAMTDEERPGSACYCGRRGCIETFLSGPALAHDYARLRQGLGATRSGGGATAEEIARLAQQGEPSACAALVRYADRMARALAAIINVLDPEVIVLGGGLSNIEQLYDTVPASWARDVFSDQVTTRLVRAAHGDSSGVRGAAWLWER